MVNRTVQSQNYSSYGSFFCVVQRWNEHIAGVAQEWADTCVYEHGFPDFDPAIIGHSSLGQNLYVTTHLGRNLKAAAFSWYNEKAYYNHDNLTCEAGHICGHYTQVTYCRSRVIIIIITINYYYYYRSPNISIAFIMLCLIVFKQERL